MTIQLLIIQCMDCRDIVSCRVVGTLVDIRTECKDCDQPPNCGVKINAGVFDISHRLCNDCCNVRMEGSKHHEC
jgi:hypothetical protein